MTLCLMLHGVGPTPPGTGAMEARYWLPLERFGQVVDLAKRTAASLTFDDGNLSDIRIALPALEKADLAGTFFIPSDRIGTPGYLSEADILSLRHAGMQIGSHGCSHVRWTDLSDARITEEITRSCDRLGGILGEAIGAVAVPFGACNLRVLRLLRRLGVGRVYSSFRGPGRDGAWIVARECLTADMPEDAVRRLFTRRCTVVDATRSFLRIWRHAGPAALWNA